MRQATTSKRDISNLTWLVHLGRPFPTTARSMQELARKWGFDRQVRDLLAGFPPDEKFEDGDDFLARCEELDLLARESADMPRETLRSPQD